MTTTRNLTPAMADIALAISGGLISHFINVTREERGITLTEDEARTWLAQNFNSHWVQQSIQYALEGFASGEVAELFMNGYGYHADGTPLA